MRRIQERRKSHYRDLRVGSIAWVIRNTPVRLMPITLQSTQPGIRIGLDERMNPDIVRGVRDGNADLGALWNLIDLTGLYVLPYRSDRSSGCGQRDRTPARHVRASLERR